MDMNSPFITAIHVPADSEFADYARWDYYQLHQLACMGFKNRDAAIAARILYRFDIEGDLGSFYIQSLYKPDWSRLPRAMDIRGPIPLQLPDCKPSDELRFRLLARPSWRVARGRAVNGKQKRYALRTEEEQMEWLVRKGEHNGFQIERCVITQRVWNDTKKKQVMPNGTIKELVPQMHKDNPKPLFGTQYDGILVVTDREKLHQAIRTGVGPQKAYGFGLLSVAPP